MASWLSLKLKIPLSPRGLSVRGGGVGFPWANLPGGNALHAWDFLNNTARWNSASVGALSNTPGWTFTRASTAYYRNSAGVLSSFASGAPRIGDRGLLVEGAATNLALYSQQMDNAAWGKFEVSITADAAVAPDGTTTADKIIPQSGATTFPNVNQSPTLTDSLDYTGSVYAKAAEWSWCFITMRSKDSGTETTVFFNLATGAIGTTGSGITATITALANGWYRCTAKKNAGTGATSPRFRVGGTTADNTLNPTGDGTSGIYLWGAQLEAASFPSSYIPTTTASATRAADVLTVPVSGIDYPLTVCVETDITQNADGVASQGLLAVSGAANNNLQIMRGPVTSLRSVVVATTSQMDTSAGSMSAFGTYKTALRVAANDSRHCLNGALQTADTSVTLPSAPTTIDFGNRGGGGSPTWSYIRRVALWTRALSDSELQSLTT